MRARLHDQIVACEDEQLLLAIKAATAPEPLQDEYRRLESHWIRLGDALKQAREISGFIEWASQRVPPPSVYKWD